MCDDIITSEPVLFLVSISGENQNSKGYTYPYIHSSRPGFDPWFGKISWRKKWQLTPVFLPGKSHEQRSLVGYRPWGRKELDTTERLHSLHLYSFSWVSFCLTRHFPSSNNYRLLFLGISHPLAGISSHLS